MEPLKTHFHEKAYTLIELLVVIVILSILAAFATARWPGRALDLSVQAQRVASDIRYTQNLALSLGLDYHIQFNGTGYQLMEGGQAVLHPSSGSTTQSLGDTQITSSVSDLHFNHQGVPEQSGGVPLTNPVEITLTLGQAQQSIEVDPSTGKVSVQ